MEKVTGLGSKVLCYQFDDFHGLEVYFGYKPVTFRELVTFCAILTF